MHDTILPSHHFHANCGCSDKCKEENTTVDSLTKGVRMAEMLQEMGTPAVDEHELTRTTVGLRT